MDQFDRFLIIMRGMDAALQVSRAKKTKQVLTPEEEELPKSPKRPPKPLAK